MSTISLGRSGIVGISYGQTSLLKSSLKRASEKNNSAISKVNGAKLKLQVDRGSSRIRVEADNLQSYYRRLKSNNTRIEKTIKDIDYIVRRIREVDNKCANAIRSIGTSYKIKSSISKVGSSLISLGDKVVRTTSSFLNDAKKAIITMYDATKNWFEKHPVVGAVISGTLFGGVVAVSGLIKDGIKIYRDAKNGKNNTKDVGKVDADEIIKGTPAANSPYKEGDTTIIFANNGEPFTATVISIKDANGEKVLVPMPDDLEGFGDACKVSMTTAEFISLIIGFSPADAVKDTLDLIAGKDVITGEDINRLIMLGLIFTPEIIDQAIKYGAKKK